VTNIVFLKPKILPFPRTKKIEEFSGNWYAKLSRNDKDYYYDSADI
jgi:hypothetical protein